MAPIPRVAMPPQVLDELDVRPVYGEELKGGAREYAHRIEAVEQGRNVNEVPMLQLEIMTAYLDGDINEIDVQELLGLLNPLKKIYEDQLRESDTTQLDPRDRAAALILHDNRKTLEQHRACENLQLPIRADTEVCCVKQHFRGELSRCTNTRCPHQPKLKC